MMKSLEDVVDLLYKADDDTARIPITALRHLSKVDSKAVANIASGATTHLLELFIKYQSEAAGGELLEIFKIWCGYENCKLIFCREFTPYVLQVMTTYHKLTKGNKDGLQAVPKTMAVE